MSGRKILAVAIGTSRTTLLDVYARNVPKELDILGRKKIITDGLVPSLGSTWGRKLTQPNAAGDFDVDYIEAPRADLYDEVCAYLRKETPAVVFTIASNATKIAKKAIESVSAAPPPRLIFVVVSDPEDEKVVRDILEPEGFVTGFSTMLRHTAPKCLQLFVHTVPTLKTVHAMQQGDMHPANNSRRRLALTAERFLKEPFTPHPIATPQDVLRYLEALPDQRKMPLTRGLLVIPDDLVISMTQKVIEITAEKNIPTFFPVPEAAMNVSGSSSALAAFGNAAEAIGEAAAEYVNAVVWRGTSVRDLPVEHLTDFQFVVNDEMLKYFGLTRPGPFRNAIFPQFVPDNPPRMAH